MVEYLETGDIFFWRELVGQMKCENDTQDGENLTGCHV